MQAEKNLIRSDLFGNLFGNIFGTELSIKEALVMQRCFNENTTTLEKKIEILKALFEAKFLYLIYIEKYNGVSKIILNADEKLHELSAMKRDGYISENINPSLTGSEDELIKIIKAAEASAPPLYKKRYPAPPVHAFEVIDKRILMSMLKKKSLSCCITCKDYFPQKSFRIDSIKSIRLKYYGDASYELHLNTL